MNKSPQFVNYMIEAVILTMIFKATPHEDEAVEKFTKK